jgi:hypothetical protein
VRRLAAWTIVVPLLVAGTEIAHALAYRLVYPQAEIRWRALAASGHSYLGYAPLVLGIVGAALLAGLASTVADAARGRAPRPLPAWAFALLPLIGFTCQEAIERWLVNDSFPWWLAQQPTFRVGLLLQVPFAVGAYVVARVLLRAARRVGAALAGDALHPVVLVAASVVRPPDALVLRASSLSLGWSVRGPPAFSV